MNNQEIEDLYIRSLDEKLSPAEASKLSDGLKKDSALARAMAQHTTAREILRIREEATFGSGFTSRLINRIQNTGIVIDRQIFGIFKKFQLVAAGIVIALLILNVAFAEQRDWKSALGLETETAIPEEQNAPVDFSETLNNL